MLTLPDITAFCLSLEGVKALRPYGPKPLAMRAPGKKYFLYLYEDQEPAFITMKCDPFEAELLRQAFDAIRPGYHCNKRHWNSLRLDGSVPDAEVLRQVRNAYGLVTGKKEQIVPLQPL